LPGTRLPARTARHTVRRAARDLPWPACGAERDHPGGKTRHEHRGRYALLHEPALWHLRQDDHQRRHHRSCYKSELQG
jgi:hypothetical protein